MYVHDNAYKECLIMEHQFYQTCAYFTAEKYTRAVEKLAGQVFMPTQLPPPYSYIMMFVEDHNPTTIMQITRNLGYDRSSVSRMTKKLVNLGFLSTTNKGRETQLMLTTKGISFLKIANNCLNNLKKLTDELLGTDKVKMTTLLNESEKKIRGWIID